MKIVITKFNATYDDLQNMIGALVDYGFKFNDIKITKEEDED